jgi:hypothetical protein
MMKWMSGIKQYINTAKMTTMRLLLHNSTSLTNAMIVEKLFEVTTHIVHEEKEDFFEIAVNNTMVHVFFEKSTTSECVLIVDSKNPTSWPLPEKIRALKPLCIVDIQVDRMGRLDLVLFYGYSIPIFSKSLSFLLK